MDKEIEQLKAEIETLKKVKDFACINLNNYIADNNKLKAENATYKANADAVQKYITQNEQLKTHIDGLEKKNAELKAYKDVNEDFKTAWEELKAENERLKEDYIKLYQQKDLDNARWQKRCTDLHIEDKAKADKYLGCLQEIKAIAEAPKPFIDISEIKSATEVGYDYAVICNKLELRLHKVLELITKAEEE